MSFQQATLLLAQRLWRRARCHVGTCALEKKRIAGPSDGLAAFMVVCGFFRAEFHFQRLLVPQVSSKSPELRIGARPGTVPRRRLD